MKRKIRFCAEAVWVAGLLLMATGVTLVGRSNLGYSMIVAPVYLLFTKLSAHLGFLTFGITEYCFQGLLILLLIPITRRFRLRYLCSFVTAVLYGYLLDGCMALGALLPAAGILLRTLWFVLGEGAIVLSVVCFMHTYLAPEAYELVVKEIATVYRKSFSRVKLCYDLASLIVSITLSLALFGGGAFRDFTWAGLLAATLDGYILEGIGIGTVIAAFVGGPLIGLADALFCRLFDMTPAIRRFRTETSVAEEDAQA